MIRIKVNRDGESIERIFQGRAVDIGRSRESDLVLDGLSYVSRRHCRIAVDGTGLCITDLGSRHGFMVNGRPSRNVALDVGDQIRIGQVTMEVVAFGPDDEPAEPVRPCEFCGQLMPTNTPFCAGCGRRPVQRRKSRLRTDQIPGYRLIRKLGAGGMGIVFEARREDDGSPAAIKILKPHLARNPSYLARFVEETRVLTMLKHPNIVRIFGRGSENGLTYIEMELVAGSSARHLIRREGAIREERALGIAWETIRGLDFAARRRIIHGDVKPSNFLLDARGGAKLCDFGLARFMRLNSLFTPLFSPESSGRKGTAAYAAPERFLSGAKPTVEGDIYSMGVSLFHMLTGELPFGTNRDARSLTSRYEVPDPRDRIASLRPATSMLVRRMMSHDPSARYPTWQAVQQDLAVLIS